MLYFNTFPKIITSDYKNNQIVLTNLMARVDVIPSLLKNPLLYYTYNYKDSDRPDIIAHKYYNDVNRFWLMLYSNQIINPQWDLPLAPNQFIAYVNDKYSSVANTVNVPVDTYINSTIYEYRKTITTYDSLSNTSTDRTIVIDLTTYNSTSNDTTTRTFSDGTYVTQTITTQAITIYQYELEQNEAKRSINLINTTYATQLEKEFQTLMR
jgi:hypothetical protein